ncbi:MAG: hypothetical protein Q7R49_00250 [Candidatus Daviesbacteria bacterium]|nr:hypothetical protein [Candidatus Daviesbacteria bacterium]
MNEQEAIEYRKEKILLLKSLTRKGDKTSIFHWHKVQKHNYAENNMVTIDCKYGTKEIWFTVPALRQCVDCGKKWLHYGTESTWG